MNAEAIRSSIKQSVQRITGIEPTDIQDSSAFRDDLGLDSLSVLELTVDMEYKYKIKVPEERLAELRTVGDTIAVIQEYAATPQA